MKIFMKRVITLMLCGIVSCSLLAGCGGSDLKTPEVSDVLKAVVESQTELEEMMDGTQDEFDFRYDIDSSKYEAFVMTYAGNGAVADEICVVKAIDKSSADEIKEVFEKRITKRTNDFEGYAPAEEAKLKKATVEQYGNYIVLIICPDSSSAAKAAKDCF